MVTITSICWFVTEITGEMDNLALSNISEIMIRLVSIYYGTNIML